MTKVESLATIATWVAMNAIAVLVAVSPLPSASETSLAQAVQQVSARA